MAKKSGNSKKSGARHNVGLKSTASGYMLRPTTRNTKNGEKLELRKYDPITRKVEVFKEVKIATKSAK
jgi:ribosomal protein L33